MILTGTVSWKGYGANEDTWLPEDQLDCDDMINEFHEPQRSSESKTTQSADVKLSCPAPSCSLVRSKLCHLREHLNKQHFGFRPTSPWLDLHDSQLCPKCSATIIAKRSKACTGCRPANAARKGPRSDSLPELPNMKRAPPVSLDYTEPPKSAFTRRLFADIDVGILPVIVHQCPRSLH